MRRSTRGRELGLILLLLGLPTLMLSFSLPRPADTNWFDRVVLRLATMPGAAVSTAAHGIGEVWRDYVALTDVRREAERVRDDNERLKRQLRQKQGQVQELSACRALLRFSAERELETVGARVIGRPASPFVRAVRLRVDQGADTLTPGLAVVVAEGVVGRVGRVYGGYADVRLAVDPQSAVDVLVRRTAARGLVTGVGSGDRYLLRLAYLLRDASVKLGDRVVTSGAGGVFPRGLPVGTVARIKKRDYGLYQEVEVEPAVDFSTLGEVLVLVPRPGAAADRGQPETPSPRPAS